MKVTYKIGTLVCLIHDPDKVTRQVVSYTVSGLGVMYTLQHAEVTTHHYDYEIITREQAMAGLN